MAVYSEVDFETGDKSQIGTEVAGTGHVEIVSSPVYTGNYACAAVAEAAYDRARIYPHLPSDKKTVKEVNVRVCFNFPRLDGYVQCIRTAGHTVVNGTRYYVYLARVVVSKGYIRLQLGMSGKNPGDWMPDPIPIEKELTVYMPFELNRWHSIEMRYLKDVNGEARIWVDEEEVLSYFGNTGMSPDVDVRAVGTVLCNAPVTVVVDNIRVADEYIGPLLRYKLNILSSPISNIPFALRSV